MSKIYIGCDPGKTSGALVAIQDGKIIDKLPVPKIGSNIDIPTHFNWLKKYAKMAKNSPDSVHAIVEQLHGLPNQKLSTIWHLSGHYHVIISILYGFKIPFTQVPPQEWQKEMFKGINIQWTMKNGKKAKDTKTMSVLAAQRLLPGQDLTTGLPRARVPNDGITDAALLSLYGKRNRL